MKVTDRTLAPALPPPQRRIGDVYYWVGVAAIALLVWVPRLRGPIDLRYDAGVYYLLGSSLAQGTGYRISSEPGSPEAVQYPPLLPIVVALHQRVLGSTDPRIVAPVLRLSYFIMFVLYAVAVALLARRYLTAGFAFAATAVSLLHFETVFLSDALFAELPLALITVAFLLVAISPNTRDWRLRGPLLFALAAASFLLKTAGITLLGALVLLALLERRWWLSIAFACLACIPFACWQGYVSHVRSSYQYKHPAYSYQRTPYQYYNVSYAENVSLVDPFRPELGRLTLPKLLRRMAGDVPSLIAAPGEGISAKAENWRRFLDAGQRAILHRVILPRGSRYLLVCATSLLVLAGLVLLTRDRAWLMVLIIIGTLGLAWLTPWPAQYHRYLVPVTALLAICAAKSIAAFSALFSTPRSRAAVAATLLLVVFAGELFATGNMFRLRSKPQAVARFAGPGSVDRYFAHDRFWQAWEQATNWIAQDAQPDAVVATSAPHFLFLYTGLRAVLPPMEADRAKERELLEQVPVTYAVVDQLEFLDISRRYARPAVENSANWTRVHQVDQTVVYRHAR